MRLRKDYNIISPHKTALFNSYKITIGFLYPIKSIGLLRLFSSFRAQPTQASERSGIIVPIYKLLYIRNKSIALLCQITSKKLQISFVQNAETLID